MRVRQDHGRLPRRVRRAAQLRQIEGVRPQGTLEAAPARGRVTMIEKTRRAVEPFLAHLPLKAPLGQIGVSLAARVAGDARILDVLLHRRCTPQLSASGWRAGAARWNAAMALQERSMRAMRG